MSPQKDQFSCRARAGVAGAPEQRFFWMSRPDLTAPVDSIFKGGELVDPDRPARVQSSCGDADLGTEPELASIGELGRSVVQDNCRIHFAQEPFGNLAVVRYDCVGVMRSVAIDVSNCI